MYSPDYGAMAPKSAVHAIHKRMTQQSVQPFRFPQPGAGGGYTIPYVPSQSAQGDSSYNQPLLPVPSQGYQLRAGYGVNGALNTQLPGPQMAGPRIDGGYSWANRGFIHPAVMDIISRILAARAK